ncbi:MAG: molybdopterin-dependent oxidoreductase [Armatimonadetes bacterium]|nr:molybdopterin-dependent oxidoreductase [Armatimonadota bacterium]
MSEIRRTACSRDCPDTCTVEVAVENGRAVKLSGGQDDPITRGFLCERTSRFLNRQYASDRLLQPLVRRGGELIQASWDEALDLAAVKLLQVRGESGPASILHYRSGGSLGILKALSSYLFEQFGPVTVKRGDICSGAGEAAQEADFGVSDSSDVCDLENSRAIFLWGKNVHTSSPHLLPVLTQARRRRCVLVGVDPVRTRLAGLCDLFVQPRAGSDYSVAMAMVRWLFEHDRIDADLFSYCDHVEEFRALAFAHSYEGWSSRCDLPVDTLLELARLYSENRPAAILVGWGLARRRNGSRTVRALDGLGAVGGNLGVSGGGVSYYFQRRAAFDLDFVSGLEVAPRSLCEPLLGPELLAAKDPPIRAIWVTAGNPVSMLPQSETVREAFLRTEFVVVVDTHPTDTTDCADLVLPTLTLLEDDDLLGAYGNHFLRSSNPVLAPPGEARHELHILQDLADRLGLGDRLRGTVDEWKARVTGRLRSQGVDPERLRRGPVRNPFAPQVAFAGRKFPTPNGRVQLMSEAAAPAPEPDPGFPFTLLAVSTPKAQSSQWSVAPGEVPEATVHPSHANGLKDGDLVLVESAVGSLEARIRLDAAVRPEVLLMPKGGMQRQGWCPNALVRARVTDHGEGAAYYDERVRIRPLAD